MNPGTHIEIGPPRRAPRIHYIDWLRVLAVLLLFPFHVSRVFNYGEPFYVKDASLSHAAGYVLGFIDVWHMPLLFFLAGASTFFALRKRGGGSYLGERVKRLLVPFAFGVLVLITPQTWYGGRFNSGYTGSFLHYLTSGDFLVMNIRDGGDYFGGFGIGHLWFIMILFLLAVIALPFFLGGRTARGTRGSAWVARLMSHPGSWILAAVLIMFGEAMPDAAGINPFYYLAFFVLGYLGFAHESFAASATRLRRLALGGGIALSLFWVFSTPLRDSLPDPSLGRAGLALLACLASWTMIVGLVGYGRRYLDRTSPALAYMAEGSYPIYILHQTVIVVLAFYVVAMPGPWVLRWALLLAGAVAVTFGLYEGIRRLPLRVLFGMRPARPRPEGSQGTQGSERRDHEGGGTAGDRPAPEPNLLTTLRIAPHGHRKG